MFLDVSRLDEWRNSTPEGVESNSDKIIKVT